MENLTVRFQRRLQSFNLNIDFVVEQGILVLFGYSGVGKTQTLETIVGLKSPDSGEITLGDRVMFRNLPGWPRKVMPPRQRRIGYVFQDTLLFPHKTVIENIGYSRQSSVNEIQDLLQEMQIKHIANKYPDEISGGQQRRVAIARALAVKPRCLLLDEPFIHLDRVVREKLIEDLVRLVKRKNIPTVLITHDLDVVAKTADNIAVIDEGNIVQAGTREEVLFRPASGAVARLFGDVNLLDGTVKGEDAGLWLIDAAGSEWRVPYIGRLELGEKVEVAILTGAIKIIKPGQPVAQELLLNMQTAVLHSADCRPNIVRGNFTLNPNITMTAMIPTDTYERAKITPGETCCLTVALNGISLFRRSSNV